MKHIETEYDGYRFRSRLEARWAVFFDNAGIDFRYEPEGILVPTSFIPGWAPPRAPYLPDFYLPDLGLYVEVKGEWKPAEKAKALNAAAYLSGQGHDVLLAPDVFRQPRGGSRRPWRLSLDGDALHAYPWPLDRARDIFTEQVETVAAAGDPDVYRDGPDLLRGCKTDYPAPDWYVKAARAAQRARFEFGERPGA
ncbi:hypothetical protein [Prauserella muralis]|uniref:hypothetical protein n=1 Tax=Prauserella muralis TaxID=588067 RepID=UPI0011AD60B3|nr:hypothetical protein [Prauserella muralis]TWE29901.1 hypothetical protein FHX69_2593 [Prauserella muralis]